MMLIAKIMNRINLKDRLVPHPTKRQVYGVFSYDDWDGIIWYLTPYVPKSKLRSPSVTRILIVDLIGRLTRTKGGGFSPNMAVIKNRYHLGYPTLARLHNHLIALLKDIGYWKKDES